MGENPTFVITRYLGVITNAYFQPVTRLHWRDSSKSSHLRAH
ncbi:hypothetical protein DT23_06795 [Thioclava indica]|uniref:Uncharacterized protein n=1 Tax=Thioclava indica TaxID=1353528 RepID=A0A074JX05_9RHOB|nr:hypothetical protein DT23_06795 [Thioclava indica]